MFLLTGNHLNGRDGGVGVTAFDWVDLSMTGPYIEPPPPYTPPKPTDVIASPLSPPSYETVTASTNGHLTVPQHNGHSPHENVRCASSWSAIYVRSHLTICQWLFPSTSNAFVCRIF